MDKVNLIKEGGLLIPNLNEDINNQETQYLSLTVLDKPNLEAKIEEDLSEDIEIKQTS